MNTSLKARPKLETIELSPSSIRTLNSCKARWIYENQILPKIENERTKGITHFGTLFHQIAEHNFKKDMFGSILFGEKLSIRNELELYADRVKKRDYFQYPSVNEKFLKVALEQEFIFRGIPDRVSYGDDRVYVIDYKTAAQPDPQKDRTQGLGYIFLVSNLEGIEPERITLILDYVKADEVYEFKTTAKEMQEYEEFLRNSFVNALTLKEAFQIHGQIRKIPHSVGDCSFCPMVGSCLAYQSTVNPVPEPLNLKLGTEVLAKELITVENFKKLYEERSKALKEALLLRDGENDSTVRDFCSIVESKMTVFPSEAVLNRILAEIVRSAVKNDKYRYLLDQSRLTEELLKSLISLVPDNLSPQSIPAGYIESLSDLQVSQPRAKYLKLRKLKEVK